MFSVRFLLVQRPILLIRTYLKYFGKKSDNQYVEVLGVVSPWVDRKKLMVWGRYPL